MAKHFKLSKLNGYDSKPIKVPERDVNGLAVTEAGTIKTKDATLVDILDLLIIAFPRERMSMENITEGVRLKNQLNDSTNGMLSLDDSTHSWVTKMLKDNSIGPKMFGFDLVGILDALDNFERQHPPKENSNDKGKARKASN